MDRQVKALPTQVVNQVTLVLVILPFLSLEGVAGHDPHFRFLSFELGWVEADGVICFDESLRGQNEKLGGVEFKNTSGQRGQAVGLTVVLRLRRVHASA